LFHTFRDFGEANVRVVVTDNFYMGETIQEWGFTVSVESDDKTEIVRNFNLSSVYPNPFNGSASINIEVPQSGELNLYLSDISGRTIQTLWNSNITTGIHRFDVHSSLIPAGQYMLVAEKGHLRKMKQLIILK